MRTLTYLEKNRSLVVAGIAVTVVALAILTIEIARLSPPDGRLGWTAALGLSASLAGLLVSVSGFGLTLSQLAETSREVDAAVKQSRKIQDFLTAYDAAQEASKATYALTAARKHLNNNAWTDALDSYEDFRRSIVSLNGNVDDLSDSIKEDVQKSTVYINRLAARIDKYVNSGYDPALMPDKAKILTVLRSHAQLISDMNAVAQRKAFDVNDR